MEFEIKQTVDFNIERLARQALDVVVDDLSEYELNYGELDDKQRDTLLEVIFSKALEILKEED